MIITALSPGVAVLNGAPFATRWHGGTLQIYLAPQATSDMLVL
jgi:hypothetical protein